MILLYSCLQMLGKSISDSRAKEFYWNSNGTESVQIHLAKPPKPVELVFIKYNISNMTMWLIHNYIFTSSASTMAPFRCPKYYLKTLWLTKKFKFRLEHHFVRKDRFWRETDGFQMAKLSTDAWLKVKFGNTGKKRNCLTVVPVKQKKKKHD